MKIVVPYRELSERCENKNTREFFADKSLLQVTVEQLKNHDVSLACIPTPSAIERADQLGVEMINLDASTATGSWSDLAVDLAHKIDHEERIAFVFCTNPVFYRFNDVDQFLAEAVIQSSLVVYPLKHYILDENVRGVNHEQGTWHQYSQHLPQWFINPWFMMSTTVGDMMKYKYWYTPDVKPLSACGPCVDIDTEEDFCLAKTLFMSCPKYRQNEVQ